MTLPACSECDQPAMAFQPGTAPQTARIGDTVITLNSGEPSRAFCKAHWVRKFGSWDLFTQTLEEGGNANQH